MIGIRWMDMVKNSYIRKPKKITQIQLIHSKIQLQKGKLRVCRIQDDRFYLIKTVMLEGSEGT